MSRMERCELFTIVYICTRTGVLLLYIVDSADVVLRHSRTFCYILSLQNDAEITVDLTTKNKLN